MARNLLKNLNNFRRSRAGSLPRIARFGYWGWPLLALILLVIILRQFVILSLLPAELADYADTHSQRFAIALNDPEADWQGVLVSHLPAETKETVEHAEDTTPLPLQEAQPADFTQGDSEESVTVIAAAEEPTAPYLSAEETTPELAGETAPASPTETTETAQEAPTTDTTIPQKLAYNLPLATAPAEAFTEIAGDYQLPRISAQGVKPWQHYRKPFADNGKPMVAIIIRGLGLGRFTTESALNLDPRVTLSFSPYGSNSKMWSMHARNIGHEILLDLPQQTADYPRSDPGPYALLGSLDEKENTSRLLWALSRAPGIVGVLRPTNAAPDTPEITRALGQLANRGIVLVDTSDIIEQASADGVAPKASSKQHALTQEMGLTSLEANRQIDRILSDEIIRKQLQKLVTEAKENGTAIGISRPYPLTLSLLESWIAELEAQGVQLAPASAILARRGE